ncbi:MAG: hypothetical protein DRN05_06840 [Thermoplasmata archaeon]|nr:MAG: hypothetical protein DRN05_06840 [Thermoplasmata archaeon]
MTNLHVTPSEVDVGDTITISVEVENVGDGKGAYTVSVNCGGERLNKEVTLVPQEKKVVFLEYTVCTIEDFKIGVAGEPLETTIKVKRDKLEEIKTIRVVIEESYPEIKKRFSLRSFYYYTCKKTLESKGFTVVSEEASQYDATLFVEIEGHALSTQYSSSGSTLYTLPQTLYTGAKINITFSLSVLDCGVIKKEEFSEEKSCPETVYVHVNEIGFATEYTNPSDAPFKEVHWEQDLIVFINDIWGR